MRVVVPLIVFFFLALFVLLALVSPRRSRRMERWVDGKLETGEEHGRDKGGRLGTFHARALRVLRRGTNNSATAGRRVHEKLER